MKSRLLWLVPLLAMSIGYWSQLAATFVFLFLLLGFAAPNDILFWHRHPTKIHVLAYLTLTLTIIVLNDKSAKVAQHQNTILPATLSCGQKLPADWNAGRFMFTRVDPHTLSMVIRSHQQQKTLTLNMSRVRGNYVFKSHVDLEEAEYRIDNLMQTGSNTYRFNFTVIPVNRVFTLHCYGAR